MANVHYRLLDSRRWSISGSNIITDGLANLSGYYIILSPEVVNSLGGTPGSTIAAATIQSSTLKQSTLDPAQPASDFQNSNWVTRGWTNPESDLETFKLDIRTWVLNNLDNSTINPGSNPFNFYLLDAVLSGTHYVVPVIYLGNDGEIINAIPIIPNVVVSNSTSVALDTGGHMWGWGSNNSMLGPVVLTSLPAFSMTDDVDFMQSGIVLAYDANSYVWAWGQASTGRFGDLRSTSANVSSPVSALCGRKFMRYFAHYGGFITPAYAIDNMSYAWAWGNNSAGYLGDNTTISKSSPVSVVGGKQWISLSVSGTHVLGLDIYSYAWAWASNAAGQRGDNTVGGFQSSPVSVVGGHQFHYLYASSGQSYGASFALDQNSYAWAWGENTTRGYLGDNTNANRSSPVSVVGGIQAIALSIGTNGAVLLDSKSYAWAWGYNNAGQVGDNSTLNRSSPVSIVGDRQWIQLLGNTGLDSKSYAWAWGGNSSGQCGDGTTLSRSSPVSVLGGHQYSKLYQLLSATVGLSGGNYYFWGIGTNGLMGDCTTISYSSPVPWAQKTPVSYSSPISIPTAMTFIAYDCDGGDLTNTQQGHIVALDANSYAWCWGSNNFGQLGGNATEWSSTPVSVVGGIQFRNVKVGGSTDVYRYQIGLDSYSYAWAWGGNLNSMLGDNSGTNRSSPVSVRGGKQWLKLAPGYRAAAALDSLSYAYGWGYNNLYGMVGDNTTSGRSSPVSVVGGRQYFDISAGDHTCAIDSNSYAWAWGVNSYGGLGDNTTNHCSSPVSVVGGHQFRRVSSGYLFTVALDLNSYAYAWGSNSGGLAGSLGDNTTVDRSSPVAVAGNLQYDTIRAEMFNVVATKGKNVYVWGPNQAGNLGLGDTVSRSSPTLATYIKNLY